MNLVELVPRDLDLLHSEAKDLLDRFPFLDGFNIPDVVRLTTRSHDAAGSLLKNGIAAIPHVRTIDRPLEETMSIVSDLLEHGLDRILFITGDEHAHLPSHNVKPLHAVEEAKKRFPNLKVYCGLDPYRASLKNELTYCAEKISAGADGFFSQPFFDPNLARIYLEQLPESEMFIGLSPIVTEASRNYWISRNHAVLPKNFDLSEESNFRLGKQLVELAAQFGQHCYLMPIKFPAADYVRGVFKP